MKKRILFATLFLVLFSCSQIYANQSFAKIKNQIINDVNTCIPENLNKSTVGIIINDYLNEGISRLHIPLKSNEKLSDELVLPTITNILEKLQSSKNFDYIDWIMFTVDAADNSYTRIYMINDKSKIDLNNIMNSFSYVEANK